MAATPKVTPRKKEFVFCLRNFQLDLFHAPFGLRFRFQKEIVEKLAVVVRVS